MTREGETEVRGPQAVLFDMDGTFVDTEPLWFDAEVSYAIAHGATWSAEDAEQTVGEPLAHTAQKLIDITGSDRAPGDVMGYLASYVMERVAAEEMRWMPGVEQLLATLNDEGIPAALVTSSLRPVAQSVVSKLDEGALQAVVSGSDVTNMKPHPEPYLRAAELLGVDIGGAVVIEDSPAGIQSGLRSGAAVIGIPGPVPMPPNPEMSRVNSASDLTLELLARIAAGDKVDLVGGAETQPKEDH